MKRYDFQRILDSNEPNPYNRYHLPIHLETLNQEPMTSDNTPEASKKGHSMSVQTQQFRAVGVNTQTGEDVSVIIDAATKAAAEVKATQMHIETTHIVRLKQDTPKPPDEHELFSSEAAEALAGKRTINLIEEVISPEEPRQAEPAFAGGSTRNARQTQPISPEPVTIVTAITRPSYAAPATREISNDNVSGLRAFGLVLIVLMLMSAGAYFVLVHQPNTINAQDEQLIFGQDLFSDVLEHPVLESPFDKLERDAFNSRASNTSKPGDPPIALDEQIILTPPKAEPASTGVSVSASSIGPEPSTPKTPTASTNSKLKLQSIVTTNQGRFAVINGKLYKQGDAFGSATLVSVADDWVLIERDGKQFTLQIAKSASKQ